MMKIIFNHLLARMYGFVIHRLVLIEKQHENIDDFINNSTSRQNIETTIVELVENKNIIYEIIVAFSKTRPTHLTEEQKSAIVDMGKMFKYSAVRYAKMIDKAMKSNLDKDIVDKIKLSQKVGF